MEESTTGILATIGVDLNLCLIPLPKKNMVIKVRVWDTAGQERFRSIVDSYFREACAALACFENEEGLDLLESYFLKSLHQYGLRGHADACEVSGSC